MNAAETVRRARLEAGLTLRALAERADTSHSTLAMYESGRKTPTTETLDRVVRAAGFALDLELRRRCSIDAHGVFDRSERGRELAEVLALAETFPARHSRRLTCPPFGVRR